MDLGPWEIAIIAVVILVLFGSAKLPNAARSLGRPMRIFKSETKGLMGDDDSQHDSVPSPQAQDAREQAARLREQAARIEQQAGVQPPQLNSPTGDGTTASGAPLHHTEHGKQS